MLLSSDSESLAPEDCQKADNLNNMAQWGGQEVKQVLDVLVVQLKVALVSHHEGDPVNKCLNDLANDNAYQNEFQLLYEPVVLVGDLQIDFGKDFDIVNLELESPQKQSIAQIGYQDQCLKHVILNNLAGIVYKVIMLYIDY